MCEGNCVDFVLMVMPYNRQDLGEVPSAVMSTYILGVDVGTTSVKAVLLETGSRSVAASHTLPTTADIIDNSGIKVGAFTYQTSTSSSEMNVYVPCVTWPHLIFHTGQRAGHRSDHRHFEPVHRPPAQRQIAACLRHRAVWTDARDFVLESKER